MVQAWQNVYDLLMQGLPDSARMLGWQHFLEALQENQQDFDPSDPEERRDQCEDALYVAFQECFPDPHHPDLQVLLHVDWKAVDEVAGQANRLAHTRGITHPFEWDWRAHPDAGVQDALDAFNRWLEPQGFCCLSWDLGWDAHLGFVVPLQQLEELQRLAAVAGMQI